MSIVKGAYSSRVNSSAGTADTDATNTLAHDSKPTGLVRQTCSWLLLFVALALLAAVVVIPRLTDATPYTVQTSSMRPQMPPGTLVVSRHVDPADLRTGDVITYQLRSGHSDVVTHRIVGVGRNGRGERLFTTKGDNNATDDPAPVRAVQVRGKVWYHVPYVGYLNAIITGREHMVAVYVVAGLLLVYAAYMLLSAARDRRRARVTARREGP